MMHRLMTQEFEKKGRQKVDLERKQQEQIIRKDENLYILLEI